MDIRRFRELLDSVLIRPIDPSAEVHLSIATELRDLNEASTEFLNSDELQLKDDEEVDAHYMVTEYHLTVRTLIDFDWTFEGPPSWDDHIEIWEPDASTAYVWLPPNEDIGRGWLPLARVEPSNNVAAYDWLLREIWGARGNGFGPKFEFLLSLPTGVTILSPDRLSLAGVRAALAKWLGDDPVTEAWEQLLDRARRSILYRGPSGVLRQMTDATDGMRDFVERTRTRSFDQMLDEMQLDDRRGASARSRLLSGKERRDQLIEMYVQLACRIDGPPSAPRQPASGADTTPPQLAALSFTPTTVNTGAGTQTITFTAHVTDDLSGLSSILLSFDSPSSGQHLVALTTRDSPGRTSGTATDGIYVFGLSVPQFAEQGTWTLRDAYLVDLAGNLRQLSKAELAAAGFATTFVNDM